jgi:4'-phosphopantetheinyl transferase
MATVWGPPPQVPVLQNGALHVWHADLSSLADSGGKLLSCLSPDEIQRAGRYRFTVHRRRFVSARHVLRHIAGLYCGIAPEAIRFRYDEHGKPELALNQTPKIHFNLSHADDTALFAFTLDARVGVDVESVRLDFSYEALIDDLLSPVERAHWSRIPIENRSAAFYRWWTRKEALLKGVGVGLTGLADFSVLPGENVSISHKLDGWHNGLSWYLHNIPLPQPFVAAAAVDRELVQIELWQWREAT